MPDNTIEIVVKAATDQALGELKKLENQLLKNAAATAKSADEYKKAASGIEEFTRGAREEIQKQTDQIGVYATKTTTATASLRGMTQGLASAASALGQLNPATQLLVQQTDNMVGMFVRGAAGATTWGTAISAGLLAVFNPLNVAILAVVATVGLIVYAFKQAAEETKKFEEAYNKLRFQGEDVGASPRQQLVNRFQRERAGSLQGVTDPDRVKALTILSNATEKLAVEEFDLKEIDKKLEEQRKEAEAAAKKSAAQIEAERKAVESYIGTLEKQEIQRKAANISETEGVAAALEFKLTQEALNIIEEHGSVVTSEQVAAINKHITASVAAAHATEDRIAVEKALTATIKDQVAQAEDAIKTIQHEADATEQARVAAIKRTRDISGQAAVEGLPEGTPAEQLNKRIAEARLKFETQRQTIRDQMEVNRGREEAVKALDEEIDAVNRLEFATVESMRTSKDSIKELNQALTDVFVSGFDKAFDAIFDTSKSFGQRMQGLFSGIGESLVKALLHGLITAPILQGLQNGGGVLGLLGLGGSVGGLGGLGGEFAFDDIISLFPFVFKEGGVVKGSPYGTPDWVRKLPPQIHRMAGGGRVTGGPTLAVIGDGGEDEFVIPKSKMKKRGQQEDRPLNIHLWDMRPRGLQKDDILAVVSDDMLRNGVTGKASVVVQSRNR